MPKLQKVLVRYSVLLLILLIISGMIFANTASRTFAAASCSSPTTITGGGTYAISTSGTCFKYVNTSFVNGGMFSIMKDATSTSDTLQWYGGMDQNATSCTNQTATVGGNGGQLNNFTVAKDSTGAMYLQITGSGANSVTLSIQNWQNGSGCSVKPTVVGTSGATTAPTTTKAPTSTPTKLATTGPTATKSSTVNPTKTNTPALTATKSPATNTPTFMPPTSTTIPTKTNTPAPTATSGPTSATSTMIPTTVTHTPILFVHGWSGSASNWNTMVSRFEQDGWPASDLFTWTYDSTQSNVTIASEVQSQVNMILQQTGASKVDIISHSMGGLSSRYYLKNLGGTSVVDAWVSLGGPNHGTTTASSCSNTDVSCVEMLPNSNFLNALNATDETPGNVRYATWWSNCDGVINPPTSVILNGATNTQTACIDHMSLLTDATVYSQVRDWVK